MNPRLEEQKEMPANKHPLKTNPHKPVDGRGPSPSRHAPSDQTGVARPRSRRVKSIIHQRKDQGGIPPWSIFYPRKLCLYYYTPVWYQPVNQREFEHGILTVQTLGTINPHGKEMADRQKKDR
jgi:hypothetical protein